MASGKQITDKLYKIKVNINLFGKSYPCVSAYLRATINAPIQFGATIIGKGGDGATSISVDAISKLAASIQEQLYKDPSGNTCSLQVETGVGKSLSIKGLVSAVNLIADTGGGMNLNVSATSGDSLMEMFNGKIYTDCFSVKKAIKDIPKGKQGPGKWYTWVGREVAGNNIAKRVDSLLSNAVTYWSKYLPDQADMPSGMMTMLMNAHKINTKVYNEIITPFLSKVNIETFEGKVNLDETQTKLAVNNGLSSYLFESGGSFLNSLLNGINRDFAMWYIPTSDNDWSSGTLINQKYGDEKVDGDITVPITRIQVNAGNFTGNRAPTCGAAIGAKIHGSAFSSYKPVRGGLNFFRIYPETPKRDYGSLYRFEAPGWLILNCQVAKDVVEAEAEQKLAEAQMPTSGREAGKVDEQAKKSEKASKKSLDSLNDILTYLAKKFYFRSLLESSNITITGPFWGIVEQNIGDMVNVKSEAGGEVCKGVLSSVNYDFTTAGTSTVTLGIALAQLPGVKIE